MTLDLCRGRRSFDSRTPAVDKGPGRFLRETVEAHSSRIRPLPGATMPKKLLNARKFDLWEYPVGSLVEASDRVALQGAPEPPRDSPCATTEAPSNFPSSLSGA